MKTVRLADGTEGEVEDYEAVLGQYVTIELRDETGMPYEADGSAATGQPVTIAVEEVRQCRE